VLEDSSLETINEHEDHESLGVQVQRFRSAMQSAMEIFDDQYARGNKSFVERFMASNGANEVCRKKIAAGVEAGLYQKVLNTLESILGDTEPA
jgi:hypothetical protein